MPWKKPKTYLRIVKYIAVYVGLMLFSYFLLAFVLAVIPVKGEQTSAQKHITVFLLQEGVHTDFVVPVNTPFEDWSHHFPYQNNRVCDTTFRWLRIGLGDKAFFLTCPTWGDLTLKKALKAMTGLNGAAIHANYEYELPGNDTFQFYHPGCNLAKLHLTPNQYQRLCGYIKNSIRFNNGKTVLLQSADSTTFDYDRYYDAHGTYSVVETCNTWINQGLQACGQPSCYWTAFGEGIFYHYGK